jgi:predicted nucleic-acid-binding Zn-ribbon protein
MPQFGEPLSPEATALVNRALEELKRRNVKDDYCPRCQNPDWTVDVVSIQVAPLQGVPAAIPSAYFPGYIEALVVVCKRCGYTMFHNLSVLGLTKPHR